MFISITDSATADNKGSSSGLVHYLEKENRLHRQEEPEYWFNGDRVMIEPYEVRRSIDNNVAKLGKNDAKFFLINISPSQKEIRFLKDEFGEDGAQEKLKAYVNNVMNAYAMNFKRPDINSADDLLWFAKLEHHRYYSYRDPEVKSGKEKRGELKQGDQMHVQVIVSRKDANNKIKLSPMNTSRGSNAEHSKKMGQFDRTVFKKSGETLFDRMFGFDRGLEESFAYANVQKNGSLAEKINMTMIEAEKMVVNENSEQMTEEKQQEVDFSYRQTAEPFVVANHSAAITVDIKDDIDDEAVYGRNRRRQRKLRINKR